MHEITIERTFAAAHALWLPSGHFESLHGHNWQVSLTVAADELDAMETVMDFHELERSLAALIEPADNGNLNDLPPFRGADGELAINPSAERVAQWLGDAVAKDLPARVRVQSVRVTEAPGCSATYRPQSDSR